MLYCKYCGDPVEDDEKFCDKCGKPTPLNDLKNHMAKQVAGPKNDLLGFIKIDIETAEKYIKYAFYMSLLMLAINTWMAFSELPQISYYWVDVVLLALLAYGVHKKYTFSAITLFLYFLLSKYFQVADGTLTSTGWVVAFVFAAVFLAGAVGAYKYHHLTEYKNHTRGSLVYGIILGLVTLGLVGFIGFSSLYPYYSESAILYRADYNDGYKAGYTDGRATTANIGDDYAPPATEERQNSYAEGYMNGLLTGCKEGGFDCSKIEESVRQMYDETQPSSI